MKPPSRVDTGGAVLAAPLGVARARDRLAAPEATLLHFSLSLERTQKIPTSKLQI